MELNIIIIKISTLFKEGWYINKLNYIIERLSIINSYYDINEPTQILITELEDVYKYWLINIKLKNNYGILILLERFIIKCRYKLYTF